MAVAEVKHATDPEVRPAGGAVDLDPAEVLNDYRIACESRELSLLGWNEVFSGKAKFGIFGDGKEVPQVAMAHSFRPGDFRSGYYRDQTFMFASGMLTLEQYLAQLYAHADVNADPASAGRAMNGHFATRSLHPDGSWMRLIDQPNCSADVSPTGSQMPRLVGLAYASKLYRQLPELTQLAGLDGFSRGGNEIAWGTIGNASCAEGMFWEAVNAAGVLGVPMLLSIWDDDYGISVHNRYQIARSDLSLVLAGFQRGSGGEVGGFDLYTVDGGDYAALRATYARAEEVVRREQVPAIVHVKHLTQPQGHSTSGSHERYKDPERLQWERENDCLLRMRRWLLASGLATAERLDEVEATARQRAQQARDRAWEAYQEPIREERRDLVALLGELAGGSAAHRPELEQLSAQLERVKNPLRRDLATASHQALIAVRSEPTPARQRLITWRQALIQASHERYSSRLYSQSPQSALRVPEVPAVYSASPRMVNGFEVLNACFAANLERYPHLIAFGEDVGKLGDVNKGMSGLQERFGDLRVTDTGIRECTIMGQAIGMAMRGLRPLAEIQYLDYLLYGLQILADDLATVQYRSFGGQKAPVIVRTRGHRLEGMWHSGSPMAAIIHLVRGMYVCVPRNMTQAAGCYNTLLQSDEPGLVVEVLNGYRAKEPMPDNIGELTLPMGVPEVLRAGSDVTVVTYGACCRIALETAETLSQAGIEVEVIDVRTLLPFDLTGRIVTSLKKTNRIVFVDEDVPGGTTAYMMREVLEVQGGYSWLDSEPRTLPATAHRPPYGSDGDYFSKPNPQQLFEAVYELMHECNPQRFPLFYR